VIQPKPKPEREIAVCNCALVVVAPTGEIRFADAEARHWLKRFFAGWKETKRLPRRICRWLEAEEHRRHSRSLMAKRKEGCLFLRPFRPHPVDSIALLLELQEDQGRRIPRRHKGLTRREHEVYRWMAEAKTNSEIGCILGIASSTAAKHAERVIAKLGVENRTGAAGVYFTAHRVEGEDGFSNRPDSAGCHGNSTQHYRVVI
jgi:DNA-binding CsgD family transcriptional regulator